METPTSPGEEEEEDSTAECMRYLETPPRGPNDRAAKWSKMTA